MWTLILGLFGVACFAVFSPHSLGALDRYRGVTVLIWAAMCVPPCLIQARWGTSITQVRKAHTDEQHVL